MSLFMRRLQPFRSGLSVIASRLLVTERLVRAQFSPVISVQCKPSLPENEFLILSSGEVVPICSMNHCAVPLWRSGAQGVPTQEPAAGPLQEAVGRGKGWGCPCRTPPLPASSTADTSEPCGGARASTGDALLLLSLCTSLSLQKLVLAPSFKMQRPQVQSSSVPLWPFTRFKKRQQAERNGIVQFASDLILPISGATMLSEKH